MSKHSKYNEISERKLRREKRTILLEGSGDDDKRWWRCWNCGFTNKSDRNTTGDGDGRTFVIGTLENDVRTGQGFQISLGGSTVLTKSSVQEKHNIGMDAIAGCSHCGSMNYK